MDTIIGIFGLFAYIFTGEIFMVRDRQKLMQQNGWMDQNVGAWEKHIKNIAR